MKPLATDTKNFLTALADDWRDPKCPKCKHSRSLHSEKLRYNDCKGADVFTERNMSDGLLREYERSCPCKLTQRDIDINLADLAEQKRKDEDAAAKPETEPGVGY